MSIAEAEIGPVVIDHWHERADGSAFWGTCTLSPLSNGEFEGYAVIAQDTTTRKQYERMLERQNDRLKEFTDILSHDLRNSLNILRGHLNENNRTGDEKHLAVIDSTTDRMERLVEDLLRVARQGQVVEHPEPTDIGSILEIAEEGTPPKTATLRYDSVPRLMADPDRLVQVFENLLRNSADHGGDNVTVQVGPLRDGFYIEDGNGYGLSVVRSIVGAHGWDVAVVAVDHGWYVWNVL